MSVSNSQEVDVDVEIDNAALSRFQVWTITLCALVAMLDGFDTQSIAFVAPVIAQEWGVDKSHFGPIFSAALVGLAFGSFALGGLADRYGRKRVIIFSTIGFGVCSLATAYAGSLNQILILRFLTGLGLGGAMPNLIALTSEYSPKRLKTTMVVLMFSGFPLGGLIGGLISTQLITQFGWSSVFVLGGLLPILLVPILAMTMPESIQYLAREGSAEKRALAVQYLSRINPAGNISDAARITCQVDDQSKSSSPMRLLEKERVLSSVLLWLVFFTNLLMFYFLISWLPTVLTGAGLPIHLAIVTALLLNAGSIAGGVGLGRIIDRIGPFRVLPLTYLLAAVFVVLIGMASESLLVLGALVFCAGFCVGGGQLVANGLASSFYPTDLRSTGVGWAMGFGRLGAISGPLIGGWMVFLELTIQQLFIVAAVPGLLAAGAVFLMGRSSSSTHLSASEALPQ